jgi:hypothetical protein
LLALRPGFFWRSTVVAGAVAAAGFAISLRLLPHLKPLGIFTNPAGWFFFAATLVLMIASAVLARAARLSASVRRWLVLSCVVFGYICVATGAFIITGIPLYVE